MRAVGGAVIGGIAGDAGTGAAVGATVGTVRGGRQAGKANEQSKEQASQAAGTQVQQQSDQAQTAYNQQMNTFKRGFSTPRRMPADIRSNKCASSSHSHTLLHTHGGIPPTSSVDFRKMAPSSRIDHGLNKVIAKVRGA